MKVVVGIVAGFAAGAILGVLFAPDKGAATRKKIVDKANDYTKLLKRKDNGLEDESAIKSQAV